MKQKPKTAAQLLNIYINSGGTKASYDEVVAACKREQLEKKIQRLKDLFYKYLPVKRKE